jgi:hypothetical protein
MIIGNGAVGIAIKWNYTIYKIPNLFIVCMEDMSAIFMNVYAFYVITIYITAQVGAFIYHKTFLSLLISFVRKGGAKEPRADN